MDANSLIEKFNASKEAKQLAIAYGGDGELLKVVAKVGDKKGIIPIRNYGQCEKHKNLLRDLVEHPNEFKHELKYSKQPFIDYEFNGNSHLFEDQAKGPIAEVVMKAADPTEALRFTVKANGKTYMKQCIADGIICATSLGSHGYFKSITRTIFNDVDAIGLGFISPTYGLCNVVLRSLDHIRVTLERDADIFISGDKSFQKVSGKTGDNLDLRLSAEGVAMYGYDIFCCPECRRGRNSTLVNDQYMV